MHAKMESSGFLQFMRVALLCAVVLQLCFHVNLLSIDTPGCDKQITVPTPPTTATITTSTATEAASGAVSRKLRANKQWFSTLGKSQMIKAKGIKAETTKSKLAKQMLGHDHKTYQSLENDLRRVHTLNKRKEVEIVENELPGKLCYVGELRDLDQVMDVYTQMLLLGQELNRVVVTPPYLINLYDIHLIDTNKTAHVSRNQAFCDPRSNTPNVTAWNDTTTEPEKKWQGHFLPAAQWPGALQEKPDEILYIGGKNLSKHTPDLFESLANENAQKKLVFASMYPHKETRALVREFIGEYLGGGKPFVALHLDIQDAAAAVLNSHQRRLVGSELQASTDPALLRWILMQHAPDLLKAPLFVTASEELKRRAPNVLQLFRLAGALTFEEPCTRLYECDMINREIAAHSAFFYASQNTPTALHIANLRRWRDNGSPFKQRPSFIHAYSYMQAQRAGWKSDGFVYPSIPSPPKIWEPATSHFQGYLSKLEKKRPVLPRELEFPPNGVLCMLGTFEQLNNVLNQVGALFHLGRIFSRTVVIPPVISELYDASFLEADNPFERIQLPDGRMYKPSRVSTNESLCDPSYGWQFARVMPKQTIESFIRTFKNDKAPVLVMGAKDAFHYGFGTREMFTHLHPHKDTREIAVKFVDEHFGNRPFVAVHLRFLDGLCYKVSKGDLACDTDPALLRFLLYTYAPHLMGAAIFVASDHQRPELELLFAKAGAVFYRGKCHSYDKQCMVIDAEIAARSAFFYGLHLSTAAQNIERFRRQRNNGTPFKQLNAFPTLTNITGPPEAVWKPQHWQGGISPEKYFASRPKESPDQKASDANGCNDKNNFGSWVMHVLALLAFMLLAVVVLVLPAMRAIGRYLWVQLGFASFGIPSNPRSELPTSSSSLSVCLLSDSPETTPRVSPHASPHRQRGGPFKKMITAKHF